MATGSRCPPEAVALARLARRIVEDQQRQTVPHHYLYHNLDRASREVVDAYRRAGYGRSPLHGAIADLLRENPREPEHIQLTTMFFRALALLRDADESDPANLPGLFRPGGSRRDMLVAFLAWVDREAERPGRPPRGYRHLDTASRARVDGYRGATRGCYQPIAECIVRRAMAVEFPGEPGEHNRRALDLALGLLEDARRRPACPASRNGRNRFRRRMWGICG